MNNLDNQLIFENYCNARKRTLNEGLLDAIKNKFKDFTADVIKPYAVKAMQFIAKNDPALAKQIAQAIKSKNLESLKNILKPGLDELSQGAKVNTEDLQTIRNFLNTGFGKGLKGAILALAAFTVVTGGVSGEDINADGTIDTVTVDDGDNSSVSMQEFQNIIDEAGLNGFSSVEDIDAAVNKAVEPGGSHEIESPTSFDEFEQKLKQDTETQTNQVMSDISKISADMKEQQAEIEQLLKDMGDGDPYAELMAMKAKHKMEKLKQDYQNKQHEIESIKIYKMGQDQKITIDQMEKMLDDLDKQYGFDLGDLKAVFN